MRADAFGLFWEDAPPEKRGQSNIVRPTPDIPDTGWRPPKDLPNLQHAKVLSLDTETRDPNLKTHGPGWARNDGEVVGISLATEGGHSWYLPIRHTIQPEFNLDPEVVLRYLKHLMAQPMPKVGANLYYDVGWLQHEGVITNGKLYDVLYAEAILFDTAKDYSLNATGERWLGELKDEEQLYKWSAKAYGGASDRKQAANIYRCPPALVGPYAEVDAELPIKILQKQWVELERLGLLDIFNLECDLIRVLIGMRYRGLPVNIEKAEKARVYLQEKETIAQNELNTIAGFDVGVYTNDDIQKLFDKNKLTYPRTEKGAASFTKDWLAAHEHPIAGLINKVRKYNKARGTFIENAILEKHVDGVIYPSFHPLRGEDGGAVSGRYSSSNPNAQQITSRDPELAPLIRGVFVPEPGFPSWIKQDLSQIEYRCFANFSGDQRLIAAYQDPKTDYHEVVSGFLGHMMPRKPVKNFNFMSLYGGGKGKVIKMLKAEFNKTQVEELLLTLTGQIPAGDLYSKLADVFIDMYQANFPAAKDSIQRDLEIAEKTGEIRTILNRRSTFDLWEPINRRNQKALPYNQARMTYGPSIKRAYCFRALNRRLQGSSADLLKKGMLDAYNQGIFNEIGFPHVTVHDELDNSYHPDLQNGFYRLQQAIENAIPMKVPVIMDAEVGPDWGNVTAIDLSPSNLIK